jgi:hypothetical protein
LFEHDLPGKSVPHFSGSSSSVWAPDAIVLGRPCQFHNHPTRIHPALNSFADECCGTLARLIAYVGALALFAIAGIHLWDQSPKAAAFEAALTRLPPTGRTEKAI